MMIIARLALIFVFAGINAGLTVLAMGSVAPFLSDPPLIALAVVVLVLLVASTFTSGNLSAGERDYRGNRWVLIAFGILQLLAAYLAPYTDRKDFWTIDGDSIRWLGVVLFAVGGALRLWPVFVRDFCQKIAWRLSGPGGLSPIFDCAVWLDEPG